MAFAQNIAGTTGTKSYGLLWSLACGVAITLGAACGGDDSGDGAAQDSGDTNGATAGDDGDDGGPADGGPGGDATDTNPGTMDDASDATSDGDTTDGTDDTADDTSDDTTGVDPDQDPLEGMGELEEVASGYIYTEGPLWSAQGGHLTFTDITGDSIYRYTPGEGTVVFRGPTDPPTFPNGAAWDLDGSLLITEHVPQRITRGDDGQEVVVDNYMGSVLNAPNDLVVHSNGGIYFSDPALATMPQFGGVTTELGFQGVYRIAPGGGLELLWDEFPIPNGVALSPDESTLYVTDTSNAAAYAFALDGDGVPTGAPTQIYDGIPVADGMCVDVNGNLYFTSEIGIAVTQPDGTPWGVIQFPARPANCTFGGDDLRTMYITVQDTVYSLELAVPGLPPTG